MIQALSFRLVDLATILKFQAGGSEPQSALLAMFSYGSDLSFYFFKLSYSLLSDIFLMNNCIKSS